MSRYRTWLRPGMMIKRWIAVLFVGILFTSLATAMGLAWLYRNYAFPERFTTLVQTGTLQFIDHPYREIIIFSPGLVLILLGLYKLTRSITAPLLEARQGEGSLTQILAAHRFRDPEPTMHIVTIGGGTGLSTLLRGLKHHPVRITAIVTAGDDGGSSGRLRTEFNVPAPGDIRNCLVALADSETLLGDLFQYRFDTEDSGLNGHSFGNLFITALAKVTGSFEQAIIESARVLNVRGAVVPSSTENIVVGAEMSDGRILRGETTIVEARAGIKRVFLDPSNAEAYQPAVAAIMSANLVVLGPGSLYTSVLPNLLVNGIAHAMRYTPAQRIYVCNVATQPGETDGYDVLDHIEGLADHLGDLPVDVVLINSNLEPAKHNIKPDWGVSPVELHGLNGFADEIDIESRDLVNSSFPLRHDPEKLAAALVDIASKRSGILRSHTQRRVRRDAIAHRDPVTVSGASDCSIEENSSPSD